ncbi:uncharacterized protein [Trachinotus anak]|uniref:uncharacterized protein n=1 Tax=Trachinotus anak TaxID=443729 RepID=UPI0039F21F30
MAALSWILTVLCVAGCHQSSASPVLRSARVVQVGQNVTLTCNLTSSMETTWYLLRSDQPLPLLTVTLSRVGQSTVVFHSANSSRITTGGDMERDPVRLEIQEVEEKDAGLYFCIGRCPGLVCVDRGILLTVNGVDGESGRDKMRLPCWSLGICVLPPLLILVLLFIFGLYLCSGKPAVCSWAGTAGSGRRLAEDGSLHYSSLKHPDRTRPSGPGGTGLVREVVTYSTVMSRRNPDASPDHR